MRPTEETVTRGDWQRRQSRVEHDDAALESPASYFEEQLTMTPSSDQMQRDRGYPRDVRGILESRPQSSLVLLVPWPFPT